MTNRQHPGISTQFLHSLVMKSQGQVCQGINNNSQMYLCHFLKFIVFIKKNLSWRWWVSIILIADIILSFFIKPFCDLLDWVVTKVTLNDHKYHLLLPCLKMLLELYVTLPNISISVLKRCHVQQHKWPSEKMIQRLRIKGPNHKPFSFNVNKLELGTI